MRDTLGYTTAGMNASDRLIINAVWDDEARVWAATSNDVPGLATEADDMEVLVERLKKMIPELLDANGVAHVKRYLSRSLASASQWPTAKPLERLSDYVPVLIP